VISAGLFTFCFIKEDTMGKLVLGKYSKSSLVKEAESTVDEVLEALKQLDYPVKLYDKSRKTDGILLTVVKNGKDDDVCVFFVAEGHTGDTWHRERSGVLQYRLHSFVTSRHNCITGRVSSKTIRGDTKDLVKKLIAQCKERCEKILEDYNQNEADRLVEKSTASQVRKLKKDFPEYSLHIVDEGLHIGFQVMGLSLQQATDLLNALSEAHIRI
jgi:hypothetical protein